MTLEKTNNIELDQKVSFLAASLDYSLHPERSLLTYPEPEAEPLTMNSLDKILSDKKIVWGEN